MSLLAALLVPQTAHSHFDGDVSLGIIKIGVFPSRARKHYDGRCYPC
jgi:hypothetical protein